MKNIYLVLLVIFTFTYSHAQNGQANNWYFGSYAGLTFNTTPPTALTNGALTTGEGCAAMSDPNGNLLFYTDGIRVWNRNHVQMPNGNGMFGDPSAAQSAMIVPKPGNPNFFYVFTVAAQGSANGFRYSEVDLTLDGGLGDVIPATKNTLLFAPSVEKCTSVKHANGLYIWVIAHGLNDNRYYSYLVDCSGVNPAITSDIGSVEGWPGWGCLTASPDGTKLATAMRSVGFEVLDFNNITGVVSNPLLLLATPSGSAYGISFSPNNNLLYALEIDNGAMYQWNLQAGSPAAIIASQVNLPAAAGTDNPYLGGTMQIGPDGLIYICQYGQPFLSTINSPNTIGVGCNLQYNTVDLLGRNTVLGLPPFIQSYFDTTAVISYIGVAGDCPNSQIDFTIGGNVTYFDSVRWHFDDALSGAANTSNLLTPSHTYASAGTYDVMLIRYLDCISDTTTRQVLINPTPATPAVASNSPVCPGSPINLSTTAVAASYAWTGPNSYSANTQNPTIASAANTNNGIYNLVVTQNGCPSLPGSTQVTVLSCPGPAVGGIINQYAAVTTFDNCTNSVTVTNATPFAVGDRVLLIQMKGAIIDSSNTAAFGDILNYNYAGNFEYCDITAINGNTISFVNEILNEYNVADAIQLVTIPSYTDVTVTSPLTAAAWNGSTGGILAFDVSGTLTLMSSLDVTGLGFRLGASSNGNGNCHTQDFVVPVSSGDGAFKGEGIVIYNSVANGGKGKLANGGGGGNMHNGGGAGGGNFGTGGNGGDGCVGCCGTYLGTGGIGGANLNYNIGRIFMGGGGGGGHQNGGTTINGGDGGGMIIVNANNIVAGGAAAVIANGQSTPDLTTGSSDGVGGGGAGGTIAIKANNITGTISASATGGKGGDNYLGSDGTGGGGGGGVLLLSNAGLQPSFATALTGGGAGFNHTIGNTNGAQPGQPGGVLAALVLPESVTPWSALDTPVVNANTPLCQGATLQLNAAGTYNASATFAWTGPNSYTSTTRNPSISNVVPAQSGLYSVIVTDSNCVTPPVGVNVVVNPTYAFTLNQTICPSNTYTLPDGTVTNTSGTYIDTLSSVSGCDSIITTNLTVVSPSIVVGNDRAICLGDSTQLTATGGMYTYNWQPATGLSSPDSANPIATPTVTTTYRVTTLVESDDLIANGDFSGGNVGFSSAYIYTSDLTPEGVYYVGSNPQTYHSGFTPCTDHTTGTGNMMIVNGSGTAGTSVWCQTINVVPNTNYAFSCWGQSVAAGSPAALQFSINGGTIGSTFNVPAAVCQWQQFYAVWNSGSNTTADICILNQNTNTGGNDFALDDIEFLGLCPVTDSIVVTVNNPVTVLVDTAICNGTTYTFPDGGNSTSSIIDTSVLTTVNGCDSTIITNLTVNPTYTADVYDTICSNATYLLPGGNSVNTTGIYTDTLNTVNGCDSIIVTYLTVNPTSASTVLDTICNGNSYTLPDGSSVTTAGSYPITLSNEYGCDSVVTTQLTVIQLTLNLSHTDVLCNGGNTGSVSATAGAGVSPYTYALTGGTSNSTGLFSNLIAGAYIVTATDDFGCTVSDNETVSEPALLTSNYNVVNLTCFESEDGEFTITPAGGTSGYTFSTSEGTNNTGVFTGLEADDYPYTVTDANGCTDTGTVTITQPDEIFVTVLPDSAIADLGEGVQLIATTNYDPSAVYNWTPITGLNCSDCANPTAVINNSMTYTVSVSVDINGNTCTTSQRVPVTIIPNYDLFIPNAFTPDGDGYNDYFEFYGNKQGIQFIEVMLFNRIGEKVFESNDIYFKWDGKYKGVVQQPGVYVYTINTVYVDGNRKEIYKGGITLIR